MQVCAFFMGYSIDFSRFSTPTGVGSLSNVIKMNGKYLPVEIKLSVSAEKDINSQLMSYCNLKQLYLTADKVVTDNIYKDNVLVIDTDKIYVYYDKKRMIKEVFELDDIESNDDIANLRVIIINLLDYS